MKLSTALKIAVSNLGRDFFVSIKGQTKKKVELATFLATIFLIGGFFYSLKPVFAANKHVKNSPAIKLSSLAENYGNIKNNNLEAKICDKDGVYEKSVASALDNKLLEEIKAIVKGTPMEPMAEEITRQDRKVAAFLVGIAKKESQMGVFSPKKAGADCYNYWGFKGGKNQVSGGYQCFSSPEEAVATVGNRLANLVDKRIDTPQKMVVWKCGSTCAGHSPDSVQKWINDISIYFNKLNAS